MLKTTMMFFRLLMIKWFLNHDERWMISQSLLRYGQRLANGTKRNSYFYDCEFKCSLLASEFRVDPLPDDPLYEYF